MCKALRPSPALLSQRVIHPSRAHANRPLRVSMKLNLERWDEAKLGPFSKDKMLQKLSSEGYDTTVYTFGPGTVFGNHSHSVSKKDAILQGRFLFRMGGEEVILEKGDQLEVPAGATHYAACVGSEPVTFVDASKC